MAVLSRLAACCNIPMLTTNCYETVHTWHPDCTRAILVALPESFRFTLKTYLTFYLFSALLAKKNPTKIDWKRFTRDVLQSSAFLMTNLVLYLWLICKMRQLLGFFTPFSLGGITSMIASYAAILVEKPTRRPALALYLVNLASETFYRHLANRGLAITFEYGQCVPFAIGLGLFMVLYSHNRLHPSIKKFLNLTHRLEPKQDDIKKMPLPQSFSTFLAKLQSDFSKTKRCEHEHSCLSLGLEVFTKNYVVGFGINAALILLKNAFKFIRNPVDVIKKLFQLKTQRLPLFFAFMPMLFHAVRCLLNRFEVDNTTVKNVAASTVSSLAMVFCPNTTIAMYTLWKGIEMCYNELVSRGMAPSLKHGAIVLYSLSTGYVLWMATIQPQSIRKGYLHFLEGLTGQRLRLFNRTLLDHFGYQSNETYKHVPELITKYTSLNPAIYQAVRHVHQHTA